MNNLEFESHELFYHEEWNSYEEGGEVEIYFRKGIYYVREGESSVYDYPGTSYWNDFRIVSEEQVLEIIDEWEEISKNY